MESYIAQKPSFSSIMMYILGKKLCKTPAHFGQISAGAGGLNFGHGWGPSRSLVDLYERDLHVLTYMNWSNSVFKVCRWLPTSY